MACWCGPPFIIVPSAVLLSLYRTERAPLPRRNNSVPAAGGQGVDRTCPGHCCVAFYLSTPHDRIDDMADEFQDGEVIADMVIPLSVAEANERLERFESDREYMPKWEGHVYTCRHFDERTRLCTIYEERPQMCRDYPYGRAGGCEYQCGFRVPVSTRG